MSKRKRSANWLLTEKMLLLDLVTDHFSVIENKKTDTQTMQQKNAEWIQISEEFNSQTEIIHRTAENLKAQWDSLKKATKRMAKSARLSLKQTGGQPTNPKEIEPVYDKVMGIISQSVSLSNGFDTDSSSIKTNDIEDCLGDETADAKHWEECSTKMLQTPSPVSTSLQFDEGRSNRTQKLKDILHCTSRRRPKFPHSSRTTEDLHRAKIKALQMQMNFAREERKESHKLFEIDLEIKKEVLRQERIKARLLFAQLKEK